MESGLISSLQISRQREDALIDASAQGLHDLIQVFWGQIAHAAEVIRVSSWN